MATEVAMTTMRITDLASAYGKLRSAAGLAAL